MNESRYGDVSSFTTIAPSAKTLCTFADKQSAAALETAVGESTSNLPLLLLLGSFFDRSLLVPGSSNGRIVQLAWQPGLSYLINATQEYRIPDPVTQFPAGVRGFLVGLLGAVPSAVTVTSAGGKCMQSSAVANDLVSRSFLTDSIACDCRGSGGRGNGPADERCRSGCDRRELGWHDEGRNHLCVRQPDRCRVRIGVRAVGSQAINMNPAHD